MRQPSNIDNILGSEHLDLASARREAISRIRGALERETADGPPNLNRSVLVRDVTGKTVLIVRFAEALN